MAPIRQLAALGLALGYSTAAIPDNGATRDDNEAALARHGACRDATARKLQPGVTAAESMSYFIIDTLAPLRPAPPGPVG